MKTVRYVLVMFVVMLAFGGVVLAQDEDNTGLPADTCTQEDYTYLQTGITNLIGGLSQIDLYDAHHIMYQVRFAVDTYQLLCTGVFTNETHPTGIIGPIYLDASLYEVTAVASGEGLQWIGFDAATLEGDCGFFNMRADGDEVPVVDLFEPNGFGDGTCVMMIDTTGEVDWWKLSFVKIQ